ncbi:MAG TPA: hypothetical protein VHO70_20720 [Chitinispirillaceae bacterium]|nr:hypothetical protein [Chitinispirillaceae bacterium]
MAYLGIGYTGENTEFLKQQVEIHMSWLKGDRLPRFFGAAFIVLYDSNTAREFAKKCQNAAENDTIVLFTMERLSQINHQ